MDIKTVIERINHLYYESKQRELSLAEKDEQNKLRRYYIDLMKNNLKAQLNTIEIRKK